MGGGMIGAQPGVGGIFGGGGGGQMFPQVGGGMDIFGGLGDVGGAPLNPGIMFQGGPLALPKQVCVCVCACACACLHECVCVFAHFISLFFSGVAACC